MYWNCRSKPTIYNSLMKNKPEFSARLDDVAENLNLTLFFEIASPRILLFLKQGEKHYLRG
jgi:hypothetical protein